MSRKKIRRAVKGKLGRVRKRIVVRKAVKRVTKLKGRKPKIRVKQLKKRRFRTVKSPENYGLDYNKGFDLAYNDGFNAGYAKGLTIAI